jgi:glycosyltransferase involved in cell wall biosynthesis
MGTLNISVVIPVYKGQDNLPALVARLERVCSTLGGEYEIILVNDGSPDKSWEVIQSMAEKHPDAQLRSAQCHPVRDPRRPS